MRRCHGCMREYRKEFDVCPHCGYIVDTAPKIKSHLAGGTVLAERYMLGRVLGHGGFGITYIAWDKKLNRTVAIKEFFPNALSTRSEGETQVSCYDDKASRFFRDGVKKMLDEGTRLSKFTDNENIVNVYDCFEENNTAYIVMEYLDGEDLKKYIEEKGGKLSPEEAVEKILPVLNALEDMHKEKLIHRDISPDNIFLCKNGKIKLLDFGSARLAIEDSDKSLSVMVKRGYAPKEQYMSRSKQGPWTDVYAVCATLYKMITGVLPTESTERDEEPLKKLSEFGINNPELEKVIFKGLEVDFGDRIQSIAQLKDGLTKSVQKKPAPIAETPKKPAEASKAVVTPKKPDTPKAAISPEKQIKKKTAFKFDYRILLAVAAMVILGVGIVFGIKAFKDKPDTSESDAKGSTAVSTTKQSAEVVHEIYESFLETNEAKKYFEVSPAFSDYYTDYEEYNTYVNSIYSIRKTTDYFDLDGDGTDECVLGVCFYADALDHYVYYIFDIDGEKVRCVDSATYLYGNHRSLHRLRIYQMDGEYYIKKYYSDPHGKAGSIYRYNGESLSFVKSYEAYEFYPKNSSEPDWKFFFSDTYNLFDWNAPNYLSFEYDEKFIADYKIKEVDADTYNSFHDECDNNEVYDLTGMEYELWDTFTKSEYFSEELTTYYECRDFNNDGNLEMFVLKFKEEYDDEAYIYPAELYFVTQQGIKVVEEDITATPGGQTNTYYISGRWFFSYIQRFSGGHDEYVYTAVDENAINVTVGGGGVEKLGDNEISLRFVDFDRYVSGGGRTNILYYFYWDENSFSFKEYGAISIDREAFLRCEGALEIFEKIESSGYTVSSILYRQNGIININCNNGEQYAHCTCELSENNQLTLLGDFGEDYGSCKAATRYDIATYPDKFPV